MVVRPVVKVYTRSSISAPWQQVSYNDSFLVFGMPLMSKTNEGLEGLIRGLTYDIETVQYKLFSRVNAYLYMEYSVYKSQISQTAQILQYANHSSSRIKHEIPNPIPNEIPRPNEIPNPRPTERQPIKRDVVFIVKPDVQNDIYYLYCLNDMQQEEGQNILKRKQAVSGASRKAKCTPFSS